MIHSCLVIMHKNLFVVFFIVTLQSDACDHVCLNDFHFISTVLGKVPEYAVQPDWEIMQHCQQISAGEIAFRPTLVITLKCIYWIKFPLIVYSIVASWYHHCEWHCYWYHCEWHCYWYHCEWHCYWYHCEWHCYADNNLVKFLFLYQSYLDDLFFN